MNKRTDYTSVSDPLLFIRHLKALCNIWITKEKKERNIRRGETRTNFHKVTFGRFEVEAYTITFELDLLLTRTFIVIRKRGLNNFSAIFTF